MNQKICKFCGTMFTPGKQFAKFCSKICGNKFRRELLNEEKDREMKEVPCPVCGQMFKPKHNKKYCRPLCQERKQRNRKQYQSVLRASLKVKVTRLWHNIRRRVEGKKSYIENGIKIKITQAEFVNWAHTAVSEFQIKYPDKVASVDRIDRNGHYELSNIRIISTEENSIRALLSKAYRTGSIECLGKTINDLCITENISKALLLDILNSDLSLS